MGFSNGGPKPPVSWLAAGNVVAVVNKVGGVFQFTEVDGFLNVTATGLRHPKGSHQRIVKAELGDQGNGQQVVRADGERVRRHRTVVLLEDLEGVPYAPDQKVVHGHGHRLRVPSGVALSVVPLIALDEVFKFMEPAAPFGAKEVPKAAGHLTDGGDAVLAGG